MANPCTRILGAKDLRCAESLPALNFDIEPGTLNLLAGSQSSGKDQLLRVLGLLERPFSGELFFDKAATTAFSDNTRTLLRNQRYGFIFSDPFLLPSFSVIENVAMPLLKVFSTPAREAREKTEAALELVGLQDLGPSPATSLSAFNQMRVALARAIAHRPAALVVDTPETNLRMEELLHFVELLRRTCKEWSATVLMTSNSPQTRPLAHRVLDLSSGQFKPDPAAAQEDSSS